MNKRLKFSLVSWGIAAVVYLLFSLWHGAFEGPLSEEEIEEYTKKYAELHPDADIEQLQTLLDNDNGEAVIMVNAIKLYDIPKMINGELAGKTSEEVLEQYTKYVFSYLIKRGSYPLYHGEATNDAVEQWGVESSKEWTYGSMIRYRSKRVMIEMSTNPEFKQFHDNKIAAIEKTIAFPTKSKIQMGGLGSIVFLVLLCIVLFIQLVFINKLKY
jgi:hypothetical protein